MARRRPPRASRTKKTNRSHKPYLIEALEERLQFVVLHGGDTFEFYANASIFERVVVTGANTTVELVGGRVDTVTGAFSLTTMDGVITAGPDAGRVGQGYTNSLTTPPDDTIFAIDVVQSSLNSSIAVAQVPDLTTHPRPMEPYTGTTTLQVNPTVISGITTNPYYVTSGGTVPAGSIVLGALSVNPSGDNPVPTNENDIPFLTANVTAGEFTYVPAGTLSAGLQIAGSFGNFLFGGTVTGTVAIHGSIQEFYAGWLVTGNTQGEIDTGVVSVPHNFEVDGDLRDLITDATIGSNSDAGAGRPTYSSGFDLYVGGRVGEMSTNDSIVGDVTIANSNPISSIASTIPDQEVENRGPATYDPWDGVIQPDGTTEVELGSEPGEPATFLYNDTFSTAQYLGLSDPAGNITVDGEIQADVLANDYVDYYAVPLMAGQTITVQVTETPLTVGGTAEPALTGDLDVGVFDPDDRLVASDYNRVDPTQTQEEPFQYTATEPGVYRFAVGEIGNPNFEAGGGPAIVLADFPYALSIQGVGNLAIGGLLAVNNILDNPNVGGSTGVLTTTPTTAEDGFHVENGDFGAAVAGGSVISEYGDAGTPFDIFSFAVDNGNLRTVQGADIGSVQSAGTFNDTAAPIVSTVAGGTRVQTQFQATVGNIEGLSPSCSVPNGSVGYLYSTGGAGSILAWNVFTDTTATLTAAQSAQYAIGGDYEMVSAQDIFVGDLIADGNIGTIRCNSMATDPASYLQVNAANNPAVHGVIDLIEVQDFLGDLADGGPAIVTGQGGNVRYITLGPYGVAYNDIFFGGGSDQVTQYQPGESVTLTDDSGTLVTLTPVGGTPSTTPTATGQTTYSTPASLYVTTYPIRGSGGAAIVQVESTDSLDVSASGVGSGQTAEIGTILLDGNGSPIIAGTAGTTTTTTTTTSGGTTTTTTTTSGTGTGQLGSGSGAGAGGSGTGNGSGGVQSIGGQGTTTTTTPAGPGEPGGPPIKSTSTAGGRYQTQTVPPSPVLPANPTVVTLTYSGSVKIDTFNITGPASTSLSGGLDGSPDVASGLTGPGNVSSITNPTGGEIVNIHLNGLGTLTTSGVAGEALEHNTSAAVQGLIIDPVDGASSNEPWIYPFLDPRSMLRIVGDLINITAGGGIANLYAGIVLGTNTFTAPTAATVPQPIVAGTPAVGSAGNAFIGGTDGEIGSINGTILGPVVAAGFVGTASSPGGVGPGGSGAVGGPGFYSVGVIGPVTSGSDFRGTEVSGKGQIGLTVNGVLDMATIGTYGEFDYAEARAGVVSVPVLANNPITNPIVDIGGITVTGNGGIIGSLIEGDHVGIISVANSGFGIIDSEIILQGEGTIAGVSAGGYGIRDGTFEGGASFGTLAVHGDGSNSPVTNYPASVRQSETGEQFDPATGYPLTFLNDIDQFLGTSAANPSIIGVTDTGVIEDLTVLGSRTLTSVSAYSIRGRTLPTNTLVSGFVSAITPSVTTFNVADSIANITVTGPINGFNLTTGRTSKYSFGGDVSAMDMTVAGPINTLVLHSSFDDGSSINAIGPSGHIGSLTIDGNLAGSVTATTYIQNLHVLGSITGTVKAARIGTINISGPVASGGLTIDGPLTNLIVNGTFGPTGSPITINGNAGVIRIKGDLGASINVTGNLKQLIVNGSILTNSNSTIGGVLNLLHVLGDVQAGATVAAALIKRQLIKGQLLGTITP